MLAPEIPRIVTGIPGLDPLIGGGFKHGSIIVVSGGTGTGRSTFAAQFLVKGALERKEAGLFISFDEHRKSMFSNLRSSYGWDLTALERDKLLVFIEYPPTEIEMFLSQDSAMRDLIDAMGIERIVIDSITPFTLLYPEPEERRKALYSLVEKMRGWDCTVLLIAEDAVDEFGRDLPYTTAGVEKLADGFIHLRYLLAEGNRRERSLEILKLRGTPHSNETYPVEITKEGIRLKKTAPARAAEAMPRPIGAVSKAGSPPKPTAAMPKAAGTAPKALGPPGSAKGKAK